MPVGLPETGKELIPPTKIETFAMFFINPSIGFTKNTKNNFVLFVDVLNLPFNKETILHACIELIYQLSRKVEAGFRKVDASFDFYQRNEIAAMRPKEVNNTCYRALRHLIYERYIK